jgi:hypothetical protein
MTRITTGLLIAILTVIAPQEAFALITGGTGNKPINDPGWPTGATVMFNHPGRVAWWEGPPLGGGQWHAECRGDSRALSIVLSDFSRLNVKLKRVVVHDGAGHSFWLAPNGEKEKLEAAKIDWVFMVWQPASWERLRKLPADLNPTGRADSSPPAQIDVYTADIDWSDVTVPAGLEVIDQRLAAHGFTTADGVVLEGKVTDLSNEQPIAAAIKLQRVEPQKKGGYLYPVVAEARTDAQGHWVLRKAPAGWIRVVVEANGFVPKVAGYARFDDQPRWQSYNCGLAHPATVSGRITDDDGKPLEGVDVRLDNVEPETGGRYESPLEYTFKTDAEGRFRAEQVPRGTATIWLNKPGYCRPGLGMPITTPKADVAMKMMKSASVCVTVDFADKQRPTGYMVSIAPEGGEVVGSYGGSGNIDARNQMTFKTVPPGRYVLRGRPNPGSDAEETGPVTVDLKGGQTAEVTLKAK